jgi:flagellar hook-associated protein 2
MAGEFSFGGLASGIDTQLLIQRLLAVARRPITNLQSRQARLEGREKFFGDLATDLGKLRDRARSLGDVADLLAYTVSSSDATKATATATGEALATAHTLEISQLARVEREKTQGHASASATGVAGTGTLTITWGGVAHDVAIGAGEDSLNGVAAAINEADFGVTATVVNDGTGATPHRLVLTGEESGAANTISVNAAGLTGGSAPLVFTEVQAARSAVFKLDGIDLTRASNTVTDALDGVTLQLVAPTTAEITLTVAQDRETVKQKLKDFVTDANRVLSRIREQFRAPEEGAGPSTRLIGDTALRSIAQRIQSALAAEVNTSGPANSLASLGIATTRDGTLELDEEKLDELLDEDFGAVADVLARTAQSTNAELAFVSAGGATQSGSFAVVVTQLAERAEVQAGTALGSGTLAADETLTFTLGSRTAEVNLAAGSTLDQVVSAINTQLDTAGIAVTASSSGGRLVLTSDSYGSEVSFSVVSDQGATDQSGIGTTLLTDAGVDVAGTIGGLAATGSGQLLTGSTGAAQGLKVRYTGATTGAVGTVTIAGGAADRLEALLDEFLDPTDGVIQGRKDALQDQQDNLGDAIERQERRLGLYEQRLKSQFAAFEGLIGRLQSQQDFLNSRLNLGR